MYWHNKNNIRGTVTKMFRKQKYRNENRGRRKCFTLHYFEIYFLWLKRILRKTNNLPSMIAECDLPADTDSIVNLRK